MNIHYNKLVGKIIVIISGLLILISPLSINSLVNFAWLLLGLSFLKKTYFVVEENKLILNSLLGPLKKIYEFDSVCNLIIKDNKVYIQQDNKRKKIGITKYLVDKNDWNSFVSKINGCPDQLKSKDYTNI